MPTKLAIWTLKSRNGNPESRFESDAKLSNFLVGLSGRLW